MKKIFLIAAFAGILFASCQKEAPVASVQNEGQQEITFTALSKAMTKGVLGDGTFDVNRKIQVAGVMKTADGQYVDFLEPAEFTKVPSKDYWAATNKVYYPIGGENKDFRFLAYSETTDANTFARWYGSKQVELQVYECAENEIVYSGFVGQKTTNGGVATATFTRTQALVSVKIKTKDDIEYTNADDVSTNAIKINKIGFKDVKTSGALVLTIDPKKDDATAKADWIYTAGCNCAFADMGSKKINGTIGTPDCGELGFVAVDPTPVAVGSRVTTMTYKNALGHYLDKYGFQLDRLFPAQILEAKTMIINYTLGENTYEVALALDGADGHAKNYTWDKGKHYTYTITVNVNEILINPTGLAGWLVVETTAGQYDVDPAAPAA